MGQGGSSEFKEAFQTTVEQLSELQLAEIGSRCVSPLCGITSNDDG